MTLPANATIVIVGIRITGPADLVRMAGWTVYADGTTRQESDYAARRLVRAMHELVRDQPELAHLAHAGDHEPLARWVLGRVVELGEIEGAEARRDNARREVASLEVQAAAARERAAGLELEAARIRGGRP